MSERDAISGEVVEFDRPDWEPLLALVGEELAEWFMWMYEIELADGSAVHAYKHIDTREYLHLAADGRTFEYTAGGAYCPIPRALALELVFARMERISPEPAVLDAVRRVLERVDQD